MNFDVIRNSRTYKYLVSIGLLQTGGYLLCLALYIFAIAHGLAHNTVSMSGGAALFASLFIIVSIAILTIILTLIGLFVFLADILDPTQSKEKLFPFGLEILSLTVYAITIFIIVITPYLCKD